MTRAASPYNVIMNHARDPIALGWVSVKYVGGPRSASQHPRYTTNKNESYTARLAPVLWRLGRRFARSRKRIRCCRVERRETVTDGVDGGLRTIGDANLEKEHRESILHRTLGEAHPFRDLLVRETSRQVL